MPGFAHFILGAGIGALLFNANSERFTRKHAIIFAVMSYLGPDIALVLNFNEASQQLGHSILGWPIYCIWLVPIYVFLTRFRFDFKKIDLVDEGHQSPKKLQWWQVYLLMVAGGLFHFTADVTFERKRVWSFPLDNPWRIDIHTFLEDLYIPGESPAHFLLYLSLGTLAFMFLFIYGLQKAEQEETNRKLNLIVIFGILIYTLIVYIFGATIISDEPDLGTMVYFTVFFLGPLALAQLSFNRPELSKEPGEYDASKGELKLKLAVGWLVFLGILAITVAFVGLNIYDSIYAMIGENYRFILANKWLWFVLLLIIGVLSFLSALLSLKKNSLGPQIAKFLLMLTSISMLSLVFWGLLRENEVVALFEENMNIKGARE